MKPSNFTLTDGRWDGIRIFQKEAENLAKFIYEHRSCGQHIGIFTSGSSGIGQNVVVDCGCNRIASQRDITDYDSW